MGLQSLPSEQGTYHLILSGEGAQGASYRRSPAKDLILPESFVQQIKHKFIVQDRYISCTALGLTYSS
jgi:hypothetical protein